MNRKFIWALITCGLIGILFLVAYFYWPTTKISDQQASNPPLSTPATPSFSTSPSAPAVNPTTNIPAAQEIKAAHEAEIKREQSVVSLWILTPITFYGKVVDEKNAPIEGAKIVLNAANQPYGVGSNYEKTSDSSGLFSISGIHGVGLTVTVSKQGYYSLPQSWGNFGYAMHGGNFKSPHNDPNDPAVFVLRKMGETESLIVQNKNVKTSRLGAPVLMDLHSGKTYGLTNGDIQIQTWTQDQNAPPGAGPHYDWRYLITVPGGGIQPRTGDFNFTAPDNGYQPTDEVKMSASDAAWDSRVTREYFLILASGEYARISFTMYAGGDNFFTITSYLNPTPGHRNLEYNPNQERNQ